MIRFTVKQASLVNKFFHAISEHQGLWQELFIRKAEVVFVEGTWKKFFNADKDDKVQAPLHPPFKWIFRSKQIGRQNLLTWTKI